MLCFILSACAHIFSLASEHDRASPLAREFLQAVSRGVEMGFAVINLPTFASAARLLDLANELIDVLADHPQTPWTAAVRAYAQGDFIAAAEILHQTGSKPEEAESRLRAAEQLMSLGRRADADAQLQPALDFYRSVKPRATSATARPCLQPPPSLVGAPAARRSASCLPARTPARPGVDSSSSKGDPMLAPAKHQRGTGQAQAEVASQPIERQPPDRPDQGRHRQQHGQLGATRGSQRDAGPKRLSGGKQEGDQDESRCQQVDMGPDQQDAVQDRVEQPQPQGARLGR